MTASATDEISAGETSAVHFFQVTFPDGHPSGIERENLVIKSGPAGLALGDELVFEGRVAVSGNLYRQFAEFTLSVFRLLPLRVLPAGLATASLRA